jgi:MFS family permease
MRGVSEADAGLILGGAAAAAGWLGVTSGGLWADRWRASNASARLHVGIASAVLPLPFAVTMLLTESNALAYVMFVLVSIASSMWIGPGASTVQDLIAPRARSIAAAAYLLVVTLIGLALGPYTIGRLSVTLGNLRNAMLVALIVNIPAVVFLLLAARKLPQDEKGMREGNA